MKRKIELLLCFIGLSFALSAQTTHNSWNYKDFPNNARIRMLNLFINVIYDVHPDTNQVGDPDRLWAELTDTLDAGVNNAAIPTYLLDFMDTAYVPGNPHGCITRLFGESSFDTLQISGDFVVVNVRESRVLRDNNNIFTFNNIAKTAIHMINESGGLQTLYGHNRISDYSCKNENRIFYSLVLFRNISREYGNLCKSCGYGIGISEQLLFLDGVKYSFSHHGAILNIDNQNIAANPTGVITHEISHSLFGGNNFHTSGGNHRSSEGTMPFMNIQGGYGLMGGANSGLVSCNGYERWRMHWKHPDSPYYISARNSENEHSVCADICKENGEKQFILRDFVTYGDAIRIKLPYKDSTITPQQYIWLEFHNILNNNKLDFLQYSNTTCLNEGTPGIYAYYQIGRDVLSGKPNKVWDNVNRDNLRIISNEGYWDYTRHRWQHEEDIVCSDRNQNEKYYYVPEFANAFGGYQDQEMFIIPEDNDRDLGTTYNSTKSCFVVREDTMHLKKIGNEFVTNSIPRLGDKDDAFSTHRKINMGTNPSTCNTKTCYTSNTNYFINNQLQRKLTFNNNRQFNNATIYLTGLSIEIIPRSDSVSYCVKIRWDDYDISEDARWTGKIVLKEQLNLKRNHSITLAQNRTPAQQYRDVESGYFAEPTRFTCESGSTLRQEPQTEIVLTEKSKMILYSGCHYTMGDSSTLRIQSESILTIRKGADFQTARTSTIIIDNKAVVDIDHPDFLHSEAQIHIRRGGKLIVNGKTINNLSASTKIVSLSKLSVH